jgi:hypothetical protein
VGLWPGLTAAELLFQPYVAGQAMYQANVFSVGEELLVELREGDTRQSDWIYRSIAGLDASYSAGLQRLSVEGQGRKFNYQRFTELNHDEYLFAGRFGWNAAQKVDGTLKAGQERRMASFINRRSTELTMELERKAEGSVNLNVNPRWRIETGGGFFKLQSPLPEFPDFTLRETSGNAALKYRSPTKFSTGIYGQYVDGRFSGVTGAPTFRSITGDVTADYEVSEFTRLSSAAGYTTLRGGGIEVDGFTASLLYRRHITAVTELKAQAFRRIEGYLAGANAVINTGFATGVTWQPTYKIRIDADYTYIFSRYRQLSPFSNVPSGRRDVFQILSGSVGYQALSWLGLRVFGGYRDRDSNLRIERFEDLMVGGEVRLQLPSAADKAREVQRDEGVPRQPT